MTASRIVALAPLAVIALLGVVWGVNGWLSPPFTDQEIRDSLVDTWEPSAWVTLLALVVLGAVAFVSLVVLLFAKLRATGTMTAVTLVLAVIGGLLAYRNHVVLTERTTALTGQTFGRFHGLL
jgi:uncharacterized membrane-anchored protein